MKRKQFFLDGIRISQENMCDCYDFSGLIIDFGVSIDCGELVGKNLRNCSQIVGLSSASIDKVNLITSNAIPDPQCCSRFVSRIYK